jgi:hypothetical protein
MTPYYEEWIRLIQLRDTFYLQIGAAVLVGLVWYRLFLRRWVRLALALGAGVVLAGLGWGVVQLSIVNY